MKKIIKTINGLSMLHTLRPAEKDEIRQAEQTLGIQFAPEYRAYLAAFGVASAEGMELTGICDFPRLNVVNVTQKERTRDPAFPGDMYVVDETGLEGLLILQDKTGTIYEFIPGGKAKSTFSSLNDYILSLKN